MTLECRPGRPCTFEITITNDGTTPFSGPVRIGDAIAVEGLGRLDGVAIAAIVPPLRLLAGADDVAVSASPP